MDYAIEIEEWMRVATPENEFRRKMKEGLIKKYNMQTTVGSLSFEYGTPYLFMHQGSCQHLLVVLDVRLPTPLDVDAKSEYPLIVFQGKLRRRKCFLCDTYTASHVTYEDKHAPSDPCFWCEQCFRRMHFDEGGSKTYDGWKAYPYQHE
jgi:snRNA-activating protein complex subunit 3